MAKIADAVFPGKSGNSYNFEVYPFGQQFNKVGAVYIFTVRSVDALNQGTHTFIYIGHTGDLSVRFDNHHKAKEINKEKPNCICIHVESNEKSRLAIEADLIALGKTPCNG